MKKIYRSMLGVTLLEIMLVLAIAAVVIIMSVRYYQSAQSSNQLNAIYSQVQAITAAADSLAAGTGDYSAVTEASMGPLVDLKTPWGSTLTISASNTDKYTVTNLDAPDTVCPGLEARLKTDPHFDSVTCAGYTYYMIPKT